MRALIYQGPLEVTVDEVPDPVIEQPTDVIVQVTTSAICGSDLHMYEGRTAAEPGITFGHENMGVVTETGSGVARVKKGDRVVLPFNIACGFCRNCTAGNTAFCLTVNDNKAGAAYGYVSMGPYRGGQAEYLRVPFADFNCLNLPAGEEHENDFILLADIFPTGYHAAAMAEVSPGDSVCVFGAGPVGLMAAYSSLLRGASTVYVVDRLPSRLKLAESIGAIAVNFTQGDAAEQIKEKTHGVGTDKGIDAVGYQATVSGGEEQPAVVLNTLVDAVRPTGKIGVVGLYLTDDPGGPTEAARKGELVFRMGQFFDKGQRMSTGQANAKAYNRQLRDLIIAGRAKPSFVVSQELPLSSAAEGYHRFDQREEGWSKVLLKPGLDRTAG